MKLILALTVLTVFHWASATVFPNLENSGRSGAEEENLSPKFRSFIHNTARSYSEKRLFNFKPRIVQAVTNEIGHRLVAGAQKVLDLIDGSQGGTTENPTISTDIPTEEPTVPPSTEEPTVPPTTDTQPIVEYKKEFLSELLDILRVNSEMNNRRRRSAVFNPEPTTDELIKQYRLIQEIGNLILYMGGTDGPGGPGNGNDSGEYK